MIHYNNTRTCYRFDITDDVTGAVIGAATYYSAGADFLAAVKRDQQAERFARFVESGDGTSMDIDDVIGIWDLGMAGDQYIQAMRDEAGAAADDLPFDPTFPCQSGKHHWSLPENAAKCCDPSWRRDLVIGDRAAENMAYEGETAYGRRWVRVEADAVAASESGPPSETWALGDIVTHPHYPGRRIRLTYVHFSDDWWCGFQVIKNDGTGDKRYEQWTGGIHGYTKVESGPPSVEHVTTDEPCATIWCDRPATVRYHGTPLCYGCGMEAEQQERDAPPAVETEHDPAAVRASILEQQAALMAIPPLELEANDTVVKEQRGVAALIKRSAPGYRKRVNTYHVLFLEDGRWVKDATSGLKKDAERAYRGYTYVPDVSAANWNSESQEAA